jgi:prepilin-type N-terminal cleavage/methylation domain-containing protein
MVASALLTRRMDESTRMRALGHASAGAVRALPWFTMGPDRRARGFTLIEAMIAAVLVGVLAALAIFGLTRWIRYSHLGEAQNLVGNIRTSEEAFLSENGAYLNVSTGVGKGNTYPSATPGAFATQWGGACGSQCTSSNAWSKLGVNPTAPVMFGYAVVADCPTTASCASPSGRGVSNVSWNGKTLNITNLGANSQPWYFVEADANYSGDQKSYTHVYGMSGDNEIYVSDE